MKAKTQSLQSVLQGGAWNVKLPFPLVHYAGDLQELAGLQGDPAHQLAIPRFPTIMPKGLPH